MRKYFHIAFICFWPIDLELVTGFIQMASSQEMILSTELMLELVWTEPCESTFDHSN